MEVKYKKGLTGMFKTRLWAINKRLINNTSQMYGYNSYYVNKCSLPVFYYYE